MIHNIDQLVINYKDKFPLAEKETCCGLNRLQGIIKL